MGPCCGLCGVSRPFGGAYRDCRPGGRPRLRAINLIRAAFPYRDPVPALLHAFKYRGLAPSGLALAGWMAGCLGRFPELGEPDALVPVPLHPVRLRERGFNQSDVLAEAVARRARRPLLRLLERTRATRAQWRLGRGAREGNLAGAFRALARLDGRRVLLIDDVCTTGETLEGCARVLKAAGAARVAAFVLARD